MAKMQNDLKLPTDTFQYWFLRKGLLQEFLDQKRIVLRDVQDWAIKEVPASRLPNGNAPMVRWIRYKVNNMLKSAGYSFIKEKDPNNPSRTIEVAIRRDAMNELEGKSLKNRGVKMMIDDVLKLKQKLEEVYAAQNRTFDSTAFDGVVEKLLELASGL